MAKSFTNCNPLPDELIYPHDANGNSATACACLAPDCLDLWRRCLVSIWFDCWDWRWALAVLIGFLAAFLIAKRARLTRLARWMLWVVWFLVAWGMTDVRRYDATSERLADLQGNARETVELQGRIAGHPVFYPGSARSSGTAAQKGSWWFDLDVSHIRRLPEWQPARGHVRVFLTGEKDLQIQRGSLWRIAGVLTDNVRLHGTAAMGSMPADHGLAAASTSICQPPQTIGCRKCALYFEERARRRRV